MKKLLTLIGAAAVSFWLYADPAEVNPNTMGFESEELGVPGSIPGALDLYATSQGYPIQWWAYDTNDIAATVTAYETAPADDNHNYLALETGSDPLYRTAAAVTVNENTMTAQQADMTGGVFFDQRVKFSAFDSDPTELSADAKVAVWLKADEERGETNLYISTAVLDAEFVPTLTNIVLHGAQGDGNSLFGIILTDNKFI